MDEGIKNIKFEELSSDLKQEVIDYYIQNAYGIEDDWYEWLWDDFVEAHNEEGFEIDRDSLDFDLGYNYVAFKGYVDEDNKNISKLRSAALDSFISAEWVYDIEINFENGKLYDNYDYDDDLIYEELETEMFGSIEVNSDAEIELELSSIKEAYDVMKKYGIDDVEYLDSLKEQVDAAEMFFQETIMVSEDKHIEFMESSTREIISHIENDFEEYIGSVNELFVELKDKFAKDLDDHYSYMQTEEYAIENLEGKSFEVEFDENGDQYRIEDLQGE